MSTGPTNCQTADAARCGGYVMFHRVCVKRSSLDHVDHTVLRLQRFSEDYERSNNVAISVASCATMVSVCDATSCPRDADRLWRLRPHIW